MAAFPGDRICGYDGGVLLLTGGRVLSVEDGRTDGLACGTSYSTLAAMNTGRISRIVQLLTTLHSGRSLTVEEMARELGVTRRTVFRDLETLGRAGVPYAFDRQCKRYRIDREFFIPPVSFTVEE